jgi:hypothetical protein
MAKEHIATYLNDHLAGAVAAIELLEHLEKAHAGEPLATFLAELRTDIAADRQELEALMKQLQAAESPTRKGTAWLGEKVTQLKLRLDDPSGGPLRLLEALDALAVGIEGKRALWRALAATAENTPRFQITDYKRLEQRAQEQRQRVEVKRLEAARLALGGGS